MTTSANTAVGAVQALVALVTRGVIAAMHHSLTLLGLTVALLAIALLARPDLRDLGESRLHGWLKERQIATLGIVPDPDAIDRATATHPHELPQQQAAIAYWLSKKYRVAPEPMAALVSEAYEQGAQHQMDPLLILAVIAIESRFNPFAQSTNGAQGLMQVMTRVHTEKYEDFGGTLAAFDPVSNMRVGIAILKNYIQRTGSIEEGLKHYVGAAKRKSDGGYSAKVLAELRRMREVADNFAPRDAATARAAQGKPPQAASTPASQPQQPAPATQVATFHPRM